jgi:branched-chain amino acid transport system ATP-binding protein
MNAVSTIQFDPASKPEAAAPFLSVQDIHSYYGESYIVQGVSFDIAHSEILALLGRNGAGKTSTLRTIARLDNPALQQGEIWLDGQPIHKLKAFEAARSGIALAQVSPGAGWELDRIYGHFPRLAERRKQEGTTLSGGEQQMLAIARALARDLKLLLLDEPYEGLAPVIVQEIETILHEIKELGITTIIVEQNAVAALKLADRAVILDTGEVAFSGSAREVLDNAELRQEYLAI